MIIFILFQLINFLNAYDKLESVNMLYVGEAKLINGKNIKKVTVSNSRVVKVTKSGQTDLLISAKKKGNSEVKIQDKKGQINNYTFTVLSAEVYQRLLAVKSALSSIKTVKTSYAGEYIYITGSINTADENDLINKIISSHKKVLSYAKLSSTLKGQTDLAIISEIQELGVYDVDYTNVSGLIYIKGSVKNQSRLNDVNHYIKQKYPNAVIDISIIPYQVDIDVKVIEVSSSSSRKLGLDIPSQYNISRHTVFSKIEIDSILNLELKKGKIKLLANPSLSSNDSEKAVFHAGGMMPIKLTSRYSSAIEWKNYGVILDFTPVVLNDNIVRLNIQSEFSNKEAGAGNSEIPSFSVRKVNTVVTVDSGRSVVISGLIHKTNSRTNSGLPILSEVPVISDIFSLNEKENTSSELAIIVTPSIRFRNETFLLDKQLEDLLVEALGEESK